MNDDEGGLIYGIEFQCRSLASVNSLENDSVRFLVGTQSLKVNQAQENQIIELELDEENRTLNKRSFVHSSGEIWDIVSCPDPKDESVLFVSRYSSIGVRQNEDETATGQSQNMEAAVWKIDSNLKMEYKFDTFGLDVHSVSWNPSDSKYVLLTAGSKALIFDVQSQKLSNSGALETRGSNVLSVCLWNPHQNSNVFATVDDQGLRGWDVRTMTAEAWKINSPGGLTFRAADFNPNKQYYVVTGGDESQIKLWDVRNPKKSLFSSSLEHSHWIWSVKFNQFHDQLLLTASSDCRVALSSLCSYSSEPYVDEEDGSTALLVKDGVIRTYDDHEDSVYRAEWSSADPWTFASISYDGRLVVNHVPRNIKFKILNLV